MPPPLLMIVATACVALNPLPTNCWIGFHGEYQLVATDGSDPGAAAVEEAALIIHARVSRIGFADFEVRTRSDGVIDIDLPPTADQIDVRELIRVRGEFAVVPLPEGVSVDEGDPIPADLAPLFGREALQQVRPGGDQHGGSALDIELTPGAAGTFADYTGRSVGQQFAIVIDGVVFTAPVIQARIDGGEAQIVGIDVDVANRLATILSLPPLPGTLNELSFSAVDPPPACPRT